VLRFSSGSVTVMVRGSFRRKVGRPPSVKNKNIRRKPDYANMLCSRWFNCLGGAIHSKLMCQWSNGNNP
jgi:hypothetical protein